jgi:hypothetical protein
MISTRSSSTASAAALNFAIEILKRFDKLHLRQWLVAAFLTPSAVIEVKLVPLPETIWPQLAFLFNKVQHGRRLLSHPLQHLS